MQNRSEVKAERYAISKKSTWVSVIVNVVLTVVQLVVGLLSGATSLVADAIHSLSDLLSDFMVLIAKYYSHKDADKEHPYGHYRYENAASLFLGFLLIAVAIGMIVSAVNKIENYQTLNKVMSIALWVACLTLIAKELLFRYMLKEAHKAKSSLLVANAWHARSDAASSLVVALGILGNLMGYHFLDPVAAIIVAFIIGKMGIQFSWNSLHDLMDRTVDDELSVEIKNVFLASEGVKGVHDLKIRKMGDLIVIDVHLEVDGQLTVEQGHRIAYQARDTVMNTYDHVLNIMTHVDPV